MTFAEQIKIDIQAWEQLLDSPEITNHQRLFLQNLLMLLYHVGLMVSEDISQGYQYAKHSSLPLASYLSHGAHITIEVEKKLLAPLVQFLCKGAAYSDAKSAESTGTITQEFGELMRKYSATGLNWTKRQAVKGLHSGGLATDQYVMAFPLAAKEVQLILGITKSLIGNMRLSILLEGYANCYPFPTGNEQSKMVDVYRLHKAAELRAGREFYTPNRLIGVKGSLSEEEFEFLKVAKFNPAILARPPAEHPVNELQSQLLPRIFANLNRENLPDYIEQFLQEFIYPFYKQYRVIEITDYNARKDFLGDWIGNAEQQTTCLVKLYISLKRQELEHLHAEQQQEILHEVVEPLLRESSRELMAVLDLRTLQHS